jgi:Domain of unknown function (DUF4389)
MAATYPVHVDAALDSGLSRWLWLVKWLLAIPHYIVLFFLWLAFLVLSIVAFVAILITARYPRAIFDFNVGVMRWSWRVTYYTWGAFGTDRYPPFTLAEVPDYPAHFSVDYPEHLSRGLVLVKWWLLAIPHYLVLALLVGSGLYFAADSTTGETAPVWSGGLIGLLAIIAAVVLLFTGRYPQQIFDLVLGLNRWVLRVAAYVSLMTDEYPPFRLDMGGSDPRPGQPPGPDAGPLQATAEPPGPTYAAPPGSSQASRREVSWGAGRVVAVVIGSLVFLLAGGLLTAGTAAAVAGQTLRDDRGFLMTPTESLSTSTYAIASEPMRIEAGTSGDALPESVLGDVALRAQAGAGDEVFIGVAPAAEVARYLSGVEHVTLTDFDDTGGFADPVYRERAGGAPSSAPGEADFWTASASGSGEQRLTWKPRDGRWTMVVMNSDGARGVGADLSIGATLPVLGWVVAGLLIAGGVLLLIAIALLLAAIFARPSQQGPAAPQGTAPTPPETPPTTPQAPLRPPTPSAPPHA